MFKLLTSLAVAVVTLTAVSAAVAAPSYESCLETANTNYSIALAIDDPNADVVHENTMADCWESQTEPSACDLANCELMSE